MGDGFPVCDLRYATLADLAALTDLDNACFLLDHTDQQRAAPGELEHGLVHGEISVVEVDEVIVGFLHADRPAPDQVWMHGLGVRADFRRRGLGGLLLDRFLTSLGASPMGGSPLGGSQLSVTTVTSPRNLPMIRLLLSRGFGARRVVRDYFGPGKDRLLCQLMPDDGWSSMDRRLVPFDSPQQLYDLLDSGRYTLRGLLVAGEGLRYDVRADKECDLGHVVPRSDHIHTDLSLGRTMARVPVLEYLDPSFTHSIAASVPPDASESRRSRPRS
ncbi:MAG TPA: GNAT family N-acetyltransferase [Mycobacteriales bacterium]|nr:GNAT family N-acetyltransferase [Mycobacteriales bacterium]